MIGLVILIALGLAPKWLTAAVAIVITAGVPVALVRGLLRLLRTEGVTFNAVAGSLAIYLSVGLLFAWIIGFITEVSNTPYFAQHSTVTEGDKVYFSFTALTTTGFGDFTPATPVGHALAVIEMLTGQLYLVTVIGLLIGNFAGRRRAGVGVAAGAASTRSIVVCTGDRLTGMLACPGASRRAMLGRVSEEPADDAVTEAPAPVATSGRPPRRHRFLIGTLFVLATLIGFMAINAVWVNRQVLDANNWADTSSRVLADKQVQTAVSAYAVDQLFGSGDPQARVKAALPPKFKPLAGPLTAGLEQIANQAAPRILASPKVQTLWRETNRDGPEGSS